MAERSTDMALAALVVEEQHHPVAHLRLVPPLSGHPAIVGWRAAAKRSLDVVLAVLALVLVAPVLVVIALAVRRDGGPVLFRQVRVGLDGVPFEVWKFRTMVTDAEARMAELRDRN